jgi:hypothetical protein
MLLLEDGWPTQQDKGFTRQWDRVMFSRRTGARSMAALCLCQCCAFTHLWRHLRELIGLRVQPPQRLQVLEVVVLREGVRQVHDLVVAPLGRHHDAPDLLDLHTSICNMLCSANCTQKHGKDANYQAWDV